MQELTLDELDAVNGGIAPLVVGAGIGLGIAIVVGIYNGYQDAKRADEKK